MANMMDYLDWRGDLPFSQAPFNDVDNLLLSELAYVDFTGIVPGMDARGEAIFLKDASRIFWEGHTDEEFEDRLSMTKPAVFVMRRMARTRRFENICLSAYVKDIDAQEQSQFSAVCASLDDGSLFVSYSGTDGTMVGWRENFNMAYLEHTPGQEKAVRYLEKAVRGTQKNVRVGGHSKGGNLAIYASVHCGEDVRGKIAQIYSNDGPGFGETTLQAPSYQKLLPLIRRIMPQQAIVGLLLEQGADYRVVRSTAGGARQHDMRTWEVLGGEMVFEEEVSDRSQVLDETLKSWISAMELPQRKRFIDTLFTMLERAKVKDVEDFYHLKWKTVAEILRSQRELTDEDRDVLSNTFKLLLGAGNETIKKTRQEKKR